MRNIRLVCAKCRRGFLWTFEERVAALNAIQVEDMFDTRKFKVKAERMKRPMYCGGCRGGQTRPS